MPWKPADAPKHDKDASTAKKKRQWAHIANSAKARGDDPHHPSFRGERLKPPGVSQVG